MKNQLSHYLTCDIKFGANFSNSRKEEFFFARVVFFSDETYRRTVRTSGPPHTEHRIAVFGPP